MKRHHSGFTLIEVLSISAIFTVLTSMLLHTVQKVETAASRTTSTNHLKIALETWKQGKVPSTLRDGSPAISVRDADWEGRFRLTSYQIESSSAEGDQLRCSVQLSLRTQHGRTLRKRATYLVSPGPQIMVARGEAP
jgi:Tfp pilus assembly protein PilV